MRKILLIFCLVFYNVVYGQNLYTITDTVNKYQIGVPEGWIYQIIGNVEQGIKIFAYRTKTGDDLPSENYNVNIVKTTETDFLKTYQDYKKSMIHLNTKILLEGEITLYERTYKWLIETHNNQFDETRKMVNYCLFTNNNGVIVILTMVTLYERFEQYKPLFDQIIQSFKY